MKLGEFVICSSMFRATRISRDRNGAVRLQMHKFRSFWWLKMYLVSGVFQELTVSLRLLEWYVALHHHLGYTNFWRSANTLKKKKITLVAYEDEISAFIFTHLNKKERSHRRDKCPEKAVLTGKATISRLRVDDLYLQFLLGGDLWWA